MSQAETSERKNRRYACRLFGMNSLKEGAMWCIYSMQELLSHRNSRYKVIHARNNRTPGLCNLFLGNGTVNTYRHATILEQFSLCPYNLHMRNDVTIIMLASM
jgi:hypothetical protein